MPEDSMPGSLQFRNFDLPDHLADRFIDLLREQLVERQIGRSLCSLRGRLKKSDRTLWVEDDDV